MKYVEGENIIQYLLNIHMYVLYVLMYFPYACVLYFPYACVLYFPYACVLYFDQLNATILRLARIVRNNVNFDHIAIVKINCLLHIFFLT